MTLNNLNDTCDYDICLYSEGNCKNRAACNKPDVTQTCWFMFAYAKHHKMKDSKITISKTINGKEEIKHYNIPKIFKPSKTKFEKIIKEMVKKLCLLES